MEKLIEVEWQDAHDETVHGTAIIEFARYNEDGVIVNEIINVFLPENIHPSQFLELKKQAGETFHNGEGYNM